MRSLFRTLTFALVLFTASTTLAAAEEKSALLTQFFSGLTTLKGEFVQTQLNPRGKVMEEARGTMVIARPGRFRIDYTAPYHQLYIADGKKIWTYDQDLQQVTVKAQGRVLGNTPALLLSSSEPIEKSFRVREMGQRDGKGPEWIELKPLHEETNFESVRIALEGNQLKVMEMLDGFGNLTRLRFDNLKRNVPVDGASFRFEPPAGVDIINDEQ